MPDLSQPSTGTHRSFIALGGNIGNVREHFVEAEISLCKNHCILSRSRLYETTPYGEPNQPNYLNAVVHLETRFGPWELLNELQVIEKRLGKQFLHPNGPRAIDLDMLTYDQQLINDPQLTLPHPHAHERDFVLLPLAEICPGFVHPRSGQDIHSLLNNLASHYFTGRTEAWPGQP